MGIYNKLSEATDSRNGGEDAEFNGYLEDYLNTLDHDHPYYELFNKLYDLDHELKICRSYHASISPISISNTIIRYKDILKLAERPIDIPYFIYVQSDNREKAILLADTYVEAKGFYYVITENGADFTDCKNEIIACGLDHPELVEEVFMKLFRSKSGYLQRICDRRLFTGYPEMFAAAKDVADKLRENIFERLKATDDQDALIHDAVVTWFILKKYAYVQFMVDKLILKEQFEGNIKAQRNQAKQNADEIRYVSIPEMKLGELFKRNKKLIEEDTQE